MALKKQKHAYQSESLFQKRLRRFRSLKRGYFSFLLIIALYVGSFFCPLIFNHKALIVKYEGKYYFPVSNYYPGKDFGQDLYGEANYRELDKQFESDGKGNWVIMPVYPFGPLESLTDPSGSPPNKPSVNHWFGTDDRGRDVFVRLAYGFNISLSFSLLVTSIGYLIGISIGASLGYFGGKYDILMQRFIEIWGSMPMIYMVIIISSVLRPDFVLLVFLLCLTAWVGMTYFMRGEFYREKSKDYVHAAIAMGATDKTIVFKHILPNALVPIITFLPFSIIGGISSLVGLDFLGFGLQPPTPSWGELVNQGMANIFSWWLVLFPLGAMFCTLLMVVFIGESIRQAFDPREFSRLR
ncbi:MAG: ABC transporter permease subunit [Calditrichaeota bacterium]|jgi:microcin C transport system permease protein|nr:ABC transporter permease subunit [Calditrichota bacterium]MBT7618364.1 ABC transporter permease subunit [Calditrichota bacterium]